MTISAIPPTTPPGTPPVAPQPTPEVSPPAPSVTPPAPPVPAAPAPDDGKLQFSQEAFRERMERERRKAEEEFLKTSGFRSLEEFKAFKKSADEKARAEMSELERIKADIAERDAKIAELDAARQAAEDAAENARTLAHLNALFAQKGITETAYATFRLEQALEALPEGQDLNEAEFIDQLLADPRQRYMLGVAGAEQPTTPPVAPVTTTPPQGGPNPQPPGPKPIKNALEMTPEEYAAYKRELLRR